MKIHVKKKSERAAWKVLAKAGKIVTANGSWQNRSTLPDSSMKRDFYPQAG